MQIHQLLSLGDLALAAGPTFGFSSEQELRSVRLLQRLRVIQNGDLGQRKASGRKGDAFVPLALILEVLPWFEDWPSGFFHRLVAARKRHRLSPSELLPRNGQFLRNFFPLIADVCEELDERLRTNPRPNQRGLSKCAPADRQWLGIKDLILASGSSYDTVKSWIARGWLGPVKTAVSSGGTTRYFIDRRLAEKAIRIARSTSSIRHMSRAVGLEPAALRIIARSAFIHPVRFGSANWNVRVIPQEVFGLTQSLLVAAVRGRPNRDGCVPLSVALRRLHKTDRDLVNPFLAALLDGSIVSRVFIAAPVSLDEITIRTGDLNRWRIAQRRRHGC